MTETTHSFQAEVKQLLDLVIHSLYTHKEIFLRELVSNASDALDKLRVAALREPDLMGAEERLAIRIELDEKRRVLRVTDNGIGMSEAEVVENIGTIARSGTKKFIEELQAAGEAGLPRLIGQFGVGFYASFMVASEVTLDTRKAGESGGTRWRSRGDGTYTVEAIEKPERGTTVELALKQAKEGPEGTLVDYAQPWRLHEIIKRYSDFVEYPIEMRKRAAGEAEDEKAEWETVNSMRPLWTRPRAEIKPEEYAEFYKAFAHDDEEPLDTIHLSAEGGSVWQALLFIPKSAPPSFLGPAQPKSQVHLYVKRVHISSDCEELLPPWLRFVRGLVDSDDLPLNISRETLQHDRKLKPIQRRLVKKVLEALEKLLTERRPEYLAFWKHHGATLKEGFWHDEALREELARVAHFDSTAGDEPTTLPQYVERMPVKQKAIYALAGRERAALLASPHLEGPKRKGYEVLLLSDPVDDFVLMRLHEFSGKPIQQIDRGELDLLDDEEKREQEARAKDLAPLLEAVKTKLGERVEDVRVSARLSESPAALAHAPSALSPQIERFLRQSGQTPPEAKRVLELNAQHPVVKKLVELRETDEARFADHCELLYEQALISEGEPPSDPKRFAQLLSKLLAGGEGTKGA